MTSLIRKLQNLRRIRQIFHVLAKYGFGYLTSRLNITFFRAARFKASEDIDVSSMPVPVRVRKSLEELGPTFVKLGQMLSTRPDLIPLNYCREFESLQDRVPPGDFEDILRQIRAEFNQEASELFEDFSSEPIAAASLAQVHEAVLSTGEKVVVKVQRPGIENVIYSDLELLHFLARLAERYIEESRFYNPTGVIAEFRKVVQQEMNFSREAKNLERFTRNFKDDDAVCFPKVFHEYSGKRVLTMEKMSGLKVSDLDGIERAGLDRKEIAVNGARIVLKQIFTHGFFHADPHPGNLFVLEDNKIAFMDFGQTGRLHSSTRTHVADLLVAVFEKDSKAVIDIFFSMGITAEDSMHFELDIEDLISRYYGVQLGDLRIGEFLADLISLIMSNRISVPADLFVLSKAMITIESIGRELDPEFNMVVQAKPFIDRIIRERYDPRVVAKDFRRFTSSGMSLARTLPADISEIIGKLKKGTTRIEFEHQGLEDFILHMDKVSNRISFSLIIAALVIGSTLIMSTDKGPMLFDFPMVGIVGFLVAGVMGLWLVVAILRSGKL